MGIIVLPVILIKMSEDDIAIWYVFSAMQSLIALLDFGFSPTFTRNVTYAFSGAKDILKDSFASTQEEETPNYNLLYAIYRLGRRLYMLLSVLVVVIMMTGGIAYYRSVIPTQTAYYYIAFLIFSGAMWVNIFFSYIPAYMKGIGAIKESCQAYVISRILYILLAVILLFCNFGLVAVTIALFISGIILRIASAVLLKKYEQQNAIKLQKSNEYSLKKLFLAMWTNTRKEGIIMIANFLIQQSATFLSTSYLGLSVSAQYGLTIQLLNIIGNISFVYFNVVSPRITQARIEKEESLLRKYFCNSFSFLALVFIVGCIGMILVGPWFLKLIGSNSTLLPTSYLIVFSLIFFLEKSHTVCASYIATSNHLPYTYPYLISSVFIFSIYVLSVLFTPLGIWGFALAQGIIQLCYNNWRWPLYVSKELKVTIPRMYLEGFKGLWTELRKA